MRLPRFTAGQYGKLLYSHWNTAASLIESSADAIAASGGDVRGRPAKPRDRWFARITEVDPSTPIIRYAGEEVIRQKVGVNEFVILPPDQGGRLMLIDGDGDKAYGVSGWQAGGASYIRPGTVVEVIEGYDVDGVFSRTIFGGHEFTMYLGRITAVNAGGGNSPSYDVEIPTLHNFTITGQTPDDRIFPDNLVTYIPKGVGDLCLILLPVWDTSIPLEPITPHLIAFEQVQTETCDGGAAQANDIDSDRGTAAARLFLHSTYI